MRLVLAVNKADLLPSQATARRLEVCPCAILSLHTPCTSKLRQWMLQLLLVDAARQCRVSVMTSWDAQAWIRRRAKQGGMPRPEAVRLVSALRGTGVDELLIQLHREVGTNGDVWVVRCHAPGRAELFVHMPALAPDIIVAWLLVRQPMSAAQQEAEQCLSHRPTCLHCVELTCLAQDCQLQDPG